MIFLGTRQLNHIQSNRLGCIFGNIGRDLVVLILGRMLQSFLILNWRGV